MSRICVVLALAACGSVKNDAQQDAPPLDPDSPVEIDSPRVPVWGGYQLVSVNRQNDGNGTELAFVSKLE
jgi:hypothetical protein